MSQFEELLQEIKNAVLSNRTHNRNDLIERLNSFSNEELRIAQHNKVMLLQTAIYDIQVLQQNNASSVNRELFLKILTELRQILPNLQFQDISGHIIYPLGRLARNRKITHQIHNKAFSTEIFIPFLEALIQKITEARHSSSLQDRKRREVFEQANKSIANTAYGLGQLAKAGHLQTPISIAVLRNLIECINIETSDTQGLANLVYGLGCLAKAGKITEGTFSSQKLESFLAALALKVTDSNNFSSSQRYQTQSRNQYTNQEIANTVYGLSELAKAGYLEASVSITALHNLMECINIETSDLVDLANLVYGLGCLAKAGKITEGIFSSEKLNNILVAFALKITDSKTSSQRHQPRQRQHANQEIANTIYGLGELAKAGHLQEPISITALHNLMECINIEAAEPQVLANFMYGLGCLAKAGKITEGTFSPHKLESLVTTLAQKITNAKTSSSQDQKTRETLQYANYYIANTIYDLGELAKAGHLERSISIKTLSNLIALIEIKTMPPQELANLVYGLGCLAKASKITGGTFSPHKLESFLTELAQKITTATNSSSSQDQKTREMLQHANQSIANTIYGLGELAKAEHLERSVSIKTLHNLMECIDINTAGSQNLANLVYGLGCLAKAGKITEGTFSPHKLESFLTALTQKITTAKNSSSSQDQKTQKILQHAHQHIANTIYGLGELAKAGHLERSISITTLHNLMEYVNVETAHPQELTQLMYGLGCLAKAGKITEGTFLPQKLDSFLAALTQKITVAKNSSSSQDQKTQKILQHANQNIANTIYGWGELAKAGHLSAPIPVTTLDNLLACVDINTPDSQDLPHLIYSLGCLAKANKLPRTFSLDNLAKLLTKEDYLDELSSSDVAKIFTGIVNFDYNNPNVVLSLFNRQLSQYVDPSMALKLLNWAIILNSTNQNQLASLFERILPSCTLPYVKFKSSDKRLIDQILKHKDLPETAKQRLKNKVRLSEGTPSASTVPHESNEGWSETFNADIELSTESDKGSVSSEPMAVVPVILASSSSASQTPDAEKLAWDRACIVSKIFDRFAEQDSPGLARLLNVSLHSTSKNQISPRVQQRNEAAYQNVPAPQAEERKEKKEANYTLVKIFFSRPIKVLEKLIRETDSAEDFELILRACPKHRQYQLATDKMLHPLILNLKLRYLERMITHFIHLGFYRDHQSILSLLDALLIRKTARPQQTEKLAELQLKLLDESFRHHELMEHHKVLKVLKEAKNNIAQNQEQSMTFDEDEEEIPDNINNNIQNSAAAPITRALNASNAGLFSTADVNTRSAPSSSSAPPVGEELPIDLKTALKEKTSIQFIPDALDCKIVQQNIQWPSNAENIFTTARKAESKANYDIIQGACFNGQWFGIRIQKLTTLLGETARKIECYYPEGQESYATLMHQIFKKDVKPKCELNKKPYPCVQENGDNSYKALIQAMKQGINPPSIKKRSHPICQESDTESETEYRSKKPK